MNENDFPKIHTGNGYDRDLAATTNDRLERTVIELRNLGTDVKGLNTNIVNFNQSSDKYSKLLLYLTLVLVIFTVILVVMTTVLISDAKKQTASQNSIALNSEFFNNPNTKIINAIGDNQPILIENHGKSTDAQLDNYLGEFDTIENSYQDGLLNESDLCDSFSYYIGITDKNPEIQNYITKSQRTDSGFFVSLSDLTKIISQSNNANCKQGKKTQ